MIGRILGRWLCSACVSWLVPVLVLLLHVNASAQTATGNSKTYTAQLTLTEAPTAINSQVVAVRQEVGKFKQEPVFKDKHPFRGHAPIQCAGISNEWAFVWDAAGGKLHLDLNGNLDLTDDPGGVYTSRGSARYQTFEQVRLPPPGKAVAPTVVVDVSLNTYGGQPSFILSPRSFLQGSVTLDQEYQVGLIESGNGDRFDLLLRPWNQRDKPFAADRLSTEVFSFPKRLFVGRAYDVERVGNGAQQEVRFTEASVPMGELSVSGQFVRKLVLRNSEWVVLLSRVADTRKVPVADYTNCRLMIETNGAQATLQEPFLSSGFPCKVNTNKPAVLVAGGPLTNIVQVAKRGRYLSLDYRLVGAGGHPYKLSTLRNEPKFAVYQGDRRLASGKFEFG